MPKNHLCPQFCKSTVEKVAILFTLLHFDLKINKLYVTSDETNFLNFKIFYSYALEHNE